MKIELGDKVRCKYSGFEGTVVSKIEFINGCIQFGVTAENPKSKKFLPPEEVAIDSKSLEIISKKRKPITDEENGGPIRKAPKLRGF